MCMAVISPTALAQPSTTNAVTGTELLRRVLAAEERVSFRARQTVVISSGKRADATITDEVNYGSARSRVTYVLPASAAGRTVIRDGKTRWTIEPAIRTIIQSEVVQRPVPQNKIGAIVNQVARTYRLVMGKEMSQVASRPVYVLELTPAQPDRPRRVWWIDKQTSLVLKRELYNVAGKLEEVSIFSNIVINPMQDAGLTVLKAPKGYRIVTRPLDNAATDLEAARRLLPTSGNIPASLGSGFDFQSARVVDASGTKSIQVQYSDGLASLSLFKMPANSKLPNDNGHGREILIGSAKGMLIQTVAPYRILSWKAAGGTLNLVSDIAEETMTRLARALRF